MASFSTGVMACCHQKRSQAVRSGWSSSRRFFFRRRGGLKLVVDGGGKCLRRLCPRQFASIQEKRRSSGKAKLGPLIAIAYDRGPILLGVETMVEARRVEP